jgi:heat shock protein HslJ
MNPHRVALAMTAVLIAFAMAACTAASAPKSGPASPFATRSAAATGFAGYKWTVTAIAHDGKITPIPSQPIPGRNLVYLQFTPDGHFGANEPVNYHSGTYTLTPGGFTTKGVGMTLAGYVGKDPVVLLAMAAISAFQDGTHARAMVSGDTLTVIVSGYTLTARRSGVQGNFQGMSNSQ